LKVDTSIENQEKQIRLLKSILDKGDISGMSTEEKSAAYDKRGQ
jgi:hypothetical protein